MSVLPKNRQLVFSIRNYIRDTTEIFSISSLVKISLTSFVCFSFVFSSFICVIWRKERVSWRSKCGLEVVNRRRKWQFSPLTLPLSKWKINFDKPQRHTCREFNCFYRLINKQITSNHNLGISKVCKMDQEAEIFKPRGTENDFLTRSTARDRPWRAKR